MAVRRHSRAHVVVQTVIVNFGRFRKNKFEMPTQSRSIENRTKRRKSFTYAPDICLFECWCEAVCIHIYRSSTENWALSTCTDRWFCTHNPATMLFRSSADMNKQNKTKKKKEIRIRTWRASFVYRVDVASLIETALIQLVYRTCCTCASANLESGPLATSNCTLSCSFLTFEWLSQ